MTDKVNMTNLILNDREFVEEYNNNIISIGTDCCDYTYQQVTCSIGKGCHSFVILGNFTEVSTSKSLVKSSGEKEKEIKLTKEVVSLCVV